MTVSIVIPTFNRAAMLGEAMASVLGQTVADLDLIVVDDGSTDATAETIRRFDSDPRLQVIRQENTGRSSARNRGLAMARGEFVGFLDSDDRLLPGALAAHLAVLEGQPEIGMTIGGYREVNEADRPVGGRRPWLSGGSLGLTGWMFDCYGMPGSVLHRRTWLERAGGFDPGLHMAEDWDLYLRMAAAECPMVWVQKEVCLYRQHGGNSVHSVEAHWEGSMNALSKVASVPEPPRGIFRLLPRAQAWQCLVFAKRALLAGNRDFAFARLADAVSLDPELGASRRVDSLEYLLGGQTGDPAFQPMVAALSAKLGATRDDLRVATARVHMAAFFRASAEGDWPQARRELGAGLRGDIRWLANRGVLRQGLRAWVEGATRR